MWEAKGVGSGLCQTTKNTMEIARVAWGGGVSGIQGKMVLLNFSVGCESTNISGVVKVINRKPAAPPEFS